MDFVSGQEPDLVTDIFVLLPVFDICKVELVCTSWRWFIVQHKIWKYKLIRKWNSNQFWKDVLQQHDWSPSESSHEINKRLCLEISIRIPDNLTDGILRAVRKESLLNDTNFTKYNVNPLENSFINRLFNDRKRIISKFPKRPWGRIGRRMGPRKLRFPMAHRSQPRLGLDPDSIPAFSKLILFSPSAFPILVSKINHSDVILAGARYGKGRIIVAGHHNVLNYEALIQVHL